MHYSYPPDPIAIPSCRGELGGSGARCRERCSGQREATLGVNVALCSGRAGGRHCVGTRSAQGAALEVASRHAWGNTRR
ncbi:hypothetical protein GUJ93_ZPchr0030g33474 [Zizania palustris]|uniref:Uncharacterized protein n=1 Tax=Zizania palustris TaxID=103762 RepID=A0A8J5R2N5_ZIZPA|nr:hypothetical protein GUJ93_ZPchr0030g33474 [Zizania palustris]